MRLRLAFFFIAFSGTTLASQVTFNEIKDASDLNHATIQSAPYDSIMSVLLYMPLFDNDGLSSIMTQFQMTVTPQATYAVRAILVQPNSSNDGTCGGTALTPYTIDNGLGNTVHLNINHAYTTTDASNHALSALSAFTPVTYAVFTLYDNNLAQIGTTSPCIQGGGICTDATNCGWPSARSWSP